MRSTGIEAVLFDMGGVLVERIDDAHRGQWLSRLAIDEAQLDHAVREAIGGGWAYGRTPELIAGELGRQLGLSTDDASTLLRDLHRDEQLSPVMM